MGSGVYVLKRSLGGLPVGTRVRHGNMLSRFARPAAGIFGATSVWRQDISAAPLHPNSSTMVQALIDTDITPNYGGVSVFNVDQYNSTLYVVPANQPLVNVGFWDSQAKGYTPPELYTTYKAFRDVPLPPNAVPGNGTDGHLAIWQPSTDRLWEFWRFARTRPGTTRGGVTPDAATAGNYTYKPAGGLSWVGPSATWGGRIDGLEAGTGWFPGNTGTTATGLAMQAGSIGIREAQAGVINHAIALSIPHPKAYATYSWPAQRSDGDSTLTGAQYIPEGLRLRIDPTRNVDAITGLHPLARMIAKAAQKYGFLVVDKSAGVEVECESAASVVAAGGTNPWPALLNGTPTYNVMKRFPWDSLQALPVDWGKP